MRLPRAAREFVLALAAAWLVLFLFGRYGDLPALRGLETASLDLRFRLRGPIQPGSAVSVVLVDDASLKAYGRWPFSRHLIARALRQLQAMGAKAVAFDLLFAESERLLPGDDPDGDLANAVAGFGHVLLPMAFSFVGPPADGDGPDYLSDSAYAKFGKSGRPAFFPLQPVAVLPPIDALGHAALGLGNVNIAYDRDGAVRYDRSVLPFSGDFYPSLAVRAAADYLGVPWSDVTLTLGQAIGVGDTVIPTDQAMRLPINFRGPPGTLPTLSFADVMGGKVPPALVKGRVVLVGASFTGNSDSFASPFSVTPMPGTEILGNTVDMIVQRDFLSEEDPPQWHARWAAAVLLMAAIAAAVSAFTSFRTTLLASAGLIGLLLAGVQLAFERGLWLPAVQPAAALLTAMGALLLHRYWTVDRDGRRVRSAFQRYMAPEMVDVLARHPEQLRLGGETRRMTMTFCDIRGFTGISERFRADPQGLTRLINRFLSPMTEVIMARRGTIDKYMGDCIMAFWNAPLDDPDHARNACRAALDMLKALGELNGKLAAEDGPGIAIGIGLNSGECVVGNMGSDLRFDYSVLGDAVNLASRLEGQSKTYGATIVIGPETRDAVADWACLELDLIAVKGKTEAVRIFALLGDEAMAQMPAFTDLAGCQDRLLQSYRRQDWPAAREALTECRKLAGAIGPLCDLYEKRIDAFEEAPPPRDWNGVFVALSK